MCPNILHKHELNIERKHDYFQNLFVTENKIWSEPRRAGSEATGTNETKAQFIP